MQQKDCKKTFTYQTRLPILTEKEDLFLSQTATLLSKVERTLFADFSKAKKLNDLKSIYLEKFSITARQFNSCRISLEGKIRSYQEGLKERISLLKTKIQKLEKHVKSCKDPSKKHQKKRRLFILKTTQKNLEKDQEEGKVRICFGGKNLFHQQFHLEENGFTQFSEWKKTWQEKRNNQFFLIGSKDETAGNQSCQLSKEGGLFTLHLRLPNGFSEKTLAIKGIDFSYGKEEIEQALEENEKRRNLRLACRRSLWTTRRPATGLSKLKKETQADSSQEGPVFGFDVGVRRRQGPVAIGDQQPEEVEAQLETAGPHCASGSPATRPQPRPRPRGRVQAAAAPAMSSRRCSSVGATPLPTRVQVLLQVQVLLPVGDRNRAEFEPGHPSKHDSEPEYDPEPESQLEFFPLRARDGHGQQRERPFLFKNRGWGLGREMSERGTGERGLRVLVHPNPVPVKIPVH